MAHIGDCPSGGPNYLIMVAAQQKGSGARAIFSSATSKFQSEVHIFAEGLTSGTLHSKSRGSTNRTIHLLIQASTSHRTAMWQNIPCGYIKHDACIECTSLRPERASHCGFIMSNFSTLQRVLSSGACLSSACHSSTCHSACHSACHNACHIDGTGDQRYLDPEAQCSHLSQEWPCDRRCPYPSRHSRPSQKPKTQQQLQTAAQRRRKKP